MCLAIKNNDIYYKPNPLFRYTCLLRFDDLAATIIYYCKAEHKICYAHLMPSTAAETIPPAYPAPSPQGYKPFKVTD